MASEELQSRSESAGTSKQADAVHETQTQSCQIGQPINIWTVQAWKCYSLQVLGIPFPRHREEVAAVLVRQQDLSDAADV